MPSRTTLWSSQAYPIASSVHEVDGICLASVLSLVGNIVNSDNKPKVHAHVVIGKAVGAALGGHLMEGRGCPILEVVIVESPEDLQWRTDKESGLVLIHIVS